MDGPRTISELYAYIVIEDDGTETVPSVQVPEWNDLPGPVLVPLIGADPAQLHALRRVVFTTPELRGKHIEIAKFQAREIIDVLKPEP